MIPKAFGVLLCIFLLLSQWHAAGQKLKAIDSLRNELRKADSDTIEVRILFELSMKYQNLQTDSAMMYVQASLEKATAIHYTKGIADALLHLGRLKRDRDDPAAALHEMFAALKLYREINDRVQIANSLNDISIVYAESEDYESSLGYFEQALEIFQQMDDKKGESYALNNIGEIYRLMGDEDMAKSYFIRSLKIKEQNNDLYGISRGYNNLGSISEHNEQWAEALHYYFKADSIFEKTDDIRAQSTNFLAIARVKEKQGRLNDALKYGGMALTLGEKVKALSYMLDASKLLAEVEEKRGNYRASLEHQKRYNLLADSLANDTHQKTLEEMKARFNSEEKEREIALLKKDRELQQARIESKNIINYSLSFGIFLMLIVAGLLYVAYRTIRSKKNSLAIKNKEIGQQKDDLDKLNREKDRFFSILSHDLRSPLNSLKGFSYLLTEHVDAMTTEELKEMRDKIDYSLDNLTQLINNLLDWSMTSSRKMKWKFDRIDIHELIQRNIALYQTTAESKHITIGYTYRDELYGYGDYHAIDTVIRNLLSNSIKFSHKNTTVNIRAGRTESDIFISIADQGIGIPPEIQEKLFTLNENVKQPGTNNEKGTGLGLTLCKELIKENKGDIQVRSTPGKGSEFTLSFPEYTHYTRSRMSAERTTVSN